MRRVSFHINIDKEMLEEIDRLRGLATVSALGRHLLELGLKEYYKLHSQKIDVAKEA